MKKTLKYWAIRCGHSKTPRFILSDDLETPQLYRTKARALGAKTPGAMPTQKVVRVVLQEV